MCLNVTAYNSLEEAIPNSDYVVLAVPSHVIRSAARSIKGLVKEVYLLYVLQRH